MPDDRLFHKRLGHSEKVNRLTDFEYIVWHSYVLSADDFGVLRFSAAALCSDHDRLEKRPPKAVQKALERVRDAGLIRTFQHQGRDYCYQDDWQDYQKIGYPRTTIHPAPPLTTVSARTRELLGKHPGGWGRKVSEPLPEGSGNVLEKPPEPLGERLGEISPEPLAVSRQPLAIAVSREPVREPPADARSKRPVFKGRRLVVFEWMLDDLARMLGSHTHAFDLHEWFYQLDEQAVSADVVVPQRDGGKWLQERTLEEAARRGLPVATTPHTGKTAGNVAAAARFIARGQK